MKQCATRHGVAAHTAAGQISVCVRRECESLQHLAAAILFPRMNMTVSANNRDFSDGG
jgi:hypothetical protein